MKFGRLSFVARLLLDKNVSRDSFQANIGTVHNEVLHDHLSVEKFDDSII